RARPFRLPFDRLALAGTLARARVRMRALPADRQALPVAQPPEATKVHEALDVHADLTPKIALDLQLARLDRLADATGLVVVEIVGALVQRHLRLLEDLARERLADSVD